MKLCPASGRRHSTVARPATATADVAAHTEVFTAAVAELLGE
jgi:hypothetical protein